MGGVLLGIAVLMTAPLFLDFAAGQASAAHFLSAIVIALFTGVTLLVLSASKEVFDLTRRQAFLTTALAWTLTPAIAALPLMSANLSFIDAYFEATSALTTTGSTVMVGLDTTSPGLLLWRSLLQWVGGIGIIVIGIIVMPFLRVGGMQLFRTESSDSSEKIFARGLDLVRWIAGIYLGLSVACAIVYGLLGMSTFDAINHAMTSIATGGFSTHDASFAYFESAGLEWAGVVFMASGALPFVAYIRTLRGRDKSLLNDIQARAFLVFLAAVIFALALTHAELNDVRFFDALRLSAFNVTSIVTTTGYASDDYQLWGPFAVGAFFILTFVGGCSGSTSGGVKMYRLQILGRVAMAHLTRLVTPTQTVVVSYGTRRVDEEVEIAILTFLCAVLISEVAITVILSWLGLDLVTALSATATCLANVGPGLGSIVGPAGNFASLPEAAKAVLSLAMILGRLEYFTLLVMLAPSFWRG
jgi:trk system potassium uptake protein TrkH